jgi:hypothetical protein
MLSKSKVKQKQRIHKKKNSSVPFRLACSLLFLFLLFPFLLLKKLDFLFEQGSSTYKPDTTEMKHGMPLNLSNNTNVSFVDKENAYRNQRQTELVTFPKFSFFVMGDTPYNKRDAKLLKRQVRQMKNTDALFVVHVGDIMKRGKCKNKSYKEAAEILFAETSKFDPLPTIVIPGDNDWVDCPDRDLAYNRFLRHFVRRNNSTLGVDTFMNFQRQKERKENFVLWKHNILFLGLNVSNPVKASVVHL